MRFPDPDQGRLMCPADRWQRVATTGTPATTEQEIPGLVLHGSASAIESRMGPIDQPTPYHDPDSDPRSRHHHHPSPSPSPPCSCSYPRSLSLQPTFLKRHQHSYHGHIRSYRRFVIFAMVHLAHVGGPIARGRPRCGLAYCQPKKHLPRHATRQYRHAYPAKFHPLRPD